MEGQATALVKLERHRYIAGLLEEVEKMEVGLFSPPNPIVEGETAIGEVTDDYVKKLYVASQFSRKEYDQLDVEHRYAPHDEGKACPTQAKQTRARYRADVLMEMFWACIQDDLGYRDEDLGVRRGWKIVTMDPSARAKKAVLGLLGRLGLEAPEE